MKRRSDKATKRRRDPTAESLPPSLASSPPSLRRSVAPSLSSTAFSFPELLFAVMILGIGMIMVAAIFPVAIKQTQVNYEETVARLATRSAENYLRQFATTANMPNVSGAVSKFDDTVATGGWHLLKGNFILPSDPSFAWVPVYRRDPAAPGQAEVFVFVVRTRTRSTYEAARDLIQPAATEPAGLQVRSVRATLADQGAVGDRVQIVAAAVGTDHRGAAAEGAFLIIAATGKIYRLGAVVDPATFLFELQPGNDMADATENTVDAPAFVIGRALADPTLAVSGTNLYEGLVQDVAVRTVLVNIP